MPKAKSPGVSSPLEPEKIWQAFTDMQSGGLGSLSWLGTKWVETMSDLGSEWLSFVADRVKEDVKLQHELLHAKTMNDVQRVQAAFIQKALDDYRLETGKVVKFCSDTMEEISAKAEEAKDHSKT